MGSAMDKNMFIIESENHFFMCSNTYNDLRTNYINNTSWPSIKKFIYIMSKE